MKILELFGFTNNNIGKSISRLLCIIIIFYHLYAAQFGAPEVMKFRSTHLAMFTSLTFLLYTFPRNQSKDRVTWYDWIFALMAWLPVVYIFFDYERIVSRYPFVEPLEYWDWVVSIIAIILTVEACRRSIGWALPIIFIVFALHALFGPIFPGVFKQAAISPKRLLDHLFMTTAGLYGSVTGISATYVFMFVLLGAILEQAKGGELFMNVAAGAMGGKQGGPAKAAVVASGMFGTISGSAVANVYATGSFTIPLMIKTGFKRTFAGAVEAVASSSGQLVPPIMGSAAFLIADFTQTPYSWVATTAIVPAFLYLFATYLMVHLEAKKENLPSMDKDLVLKARRDIWKGIHLIFSIVILVILLAFQYTVFYSAYIGVVSAILLAQIRRYTRMDLKSILDGFEKGAQRVVPIALALFVASMVVGVIELSGLGLRFTSILLKISGGNLLITLLLVMISCIILGMGLPTSAAYLIVAIFSAPALIKLGVQPLAAHFFVFYYAIISAITPPVAVAAYAAATIAQTSMHATGWMAVRLAAAVYIVPFVMIYNPAMILIGSWPMVIQSIVTCIVGIFGLAIAVQGFLFREVSVPERILAGISALMLLHGGTETDIIGAALLCIVLLIQWIRKRNFRKRPIPKIKGSHKKE
jgi:TRAP transporter 4TM/12TM fusion protein